VNVINPHQFEVERTETGFLLPIIPEPAGLCLINGRTYLVHDGKVLDFEYVETGVMLTDRRTQVQYPERRLGFKRENILKLRGPVACLHPDPALTVVSDGIVLNMGPLRPTDGIVSHIYDVQHNVLWRPYNQEERDQEVGDSDRSFWLVTQVDTLAMKAHESGPRASYWNDFKTHDNWTPISYGVTYQIKE